MWMSSEEEGGSDPVLWLNCSFNFSLSTRSRLRHNRRRNDEKKAEHEL